MSRFQPDCKVYVGDLGDRTEKPDIEEAFSSYGKLNSIWVARNPPGFAFVEFEDKLDAQDAIRALDGKKLNGHAIRVELARGRSRGGRGGGGRGGFRGGGGGSRYGGGGRDSYGGGGDYRDRGYNDRGSRGGRDSYRQRSRSRSPKRRHSRSRSPNRSRSPSPAN